MSCSNLNLFYGAICSSRFILIVIFVVFILASISIFVIGGIYNRYFHRLKGFPGPFWSSVTDLSQLSALSCHDITAYSLELHQKYGAIVRIAPNLISFSDPRAIPLVYHRDVDKNEFWTPGALGEHPPLLQTRDHREHAKKRKVIAPVVSRIFDLRPLYSLISKVSSKLSLKSLLAMEERIDLNLRSFLDQIKDHYAKLKCKGRLSIWVQWCLYDTTTDILFKKRLGFVRKGTDVDGLLAAFRNTGWVIGLMALFPYLLKPLFQMPVIGKFLLPRSGDRIGVGKVMKYRDSLTHASPAKREPTLLDCAALIIALLRRLRQSQSKHSEDISDDDLSAEILLLMVAAPDTSSALICATIESVISSPSVHAKVMDEISKFTLQGQLGSPIASYAQIKSMPYFTSCVWEAARLFPSIPVVLPRRVSTAGIWLNGRYIPEGTSIGACAPVINRDPGIYGPDSDVFRPERWLGPLDQVKQMHRFLFTWGFGTRKCVGKNLALIETYKICLQLLREFDMTCDVSQGRANRHETKGFAFYDDFYVHFKEREKL